MHSFVLCCISHLDSNISSNIYYESIGFDIIKFVRTNSDVDTFVTLPSCLLKKIQKQEIKHRSIMSMSNKIFGKYITVFNVLGDTAANFIKLFSLPLARTKQIHVFCLFNSLFVCLFICLFVWLSCY